MCNVINVKTHAKPLDNKRSKRQLDSAETTGKVILQKVACLKVCRSIII